MTQRKAIRANGSAILTLNGKRVFYKGLGSLKKDIDLNEILKAAQDTPDRWKKYFLESEDHAVRLVIYGDKLNFSFLKQEDVPRFNIDGQSFLLMGYDRQPSTAWEGFITGATTGIQKAAEATTEVGRALIANAGWAGASLATFGIGLFAIGKLTGSSLSQVLPRIGLPALATMGSAVGVGTVIYGVAGGFMRAAEVANRPHDLKLLNQLLDRTPPQGEGSGTAAPTNSAVNDAPGPGSQPAPPSEAPKS